MDSINIVCPVCTLYLRPGITLKQHLTSHPKQKVIEALVKLAGVDEPPKPQSTPSVPGFSPHFSSPGASSSANQINSTVANQPWNQPTPVQVGPPNPLQGGNHLFIYQQSMSTSSPQGNVLQVNPMSQPYIYHPTILNPPMMPYVYQQQQVILSSNYPQIRALPFESPNSEESITEKAAIEETVPENNDENEVERSEIPEIEKDTNENEVLLIEDEVEEPALTKKEMDSLHHEHDIKTMEDFEHERIELNEIPPEEYNDSEEECYESDNQDREDMAGSPCSEDSDWKIDSELSKACQTQIANAHTPTSEIEENEHLTEPHETHYVDMDEPEYLYCGQYTETIETCGKYAAPFGTKFASEEPENGNTSILPQEQQNNVSAPYSVPKENEHYEQTDPIYTSANILHGNDHLDFMNLDDIVIIGDFNSNNVASQVENFENTLHDRPGVLMTIGEIPDHQKVDYNDQRDFEESMSRSSSHVNIRSDERMPARGELSGQESMGGSSDITWNRLQYQEGSSRMSHYYEMIGRESWEASDSESVDTPPVKKQNATQVSQEHDIYEDNDNDMPTIIGYSGPPRNFRCSTCGEAFVSSRERKEHESEKHPEKMRSNIIGGEIGKKHVKKLTIKAKSEKTKAEPNFDSIFANKLKIENKIEAESIALESTVKMDDPPIEIPEIKAICPICDCVLDSVKSLKQHRLEVHKESLAPRHKCLTCGDVFPNEYKYTDHLKIHPLECRLCGKLFFRKQNIRLHMKRHLGLKPYKCDICDKSFVTRQKLDEHRNVHTGEAPIKCNLCDEKFRRYSNLVQHKNRHHFQIKKKIKDYICHCGEIFHSKKKLAWHKEVHDPKPKACSQCSEKFLHMSSLTRHMRRAHNDKFLPEENRQNENVECPICKGTYLRSSLEVHIKNHSGSRPYTCLMCNKDFTTKWNLKLHKWTHASRTSKPYKCDQCKGAFIRESDYTAHMNSHKSVRPYTCNYCGAQFIRKYNCLRHVKEHENDKTFSCTVCGKTFHRSYYLKDHMRVHSGVRPYTCHICGKTSTTKSNHNKHVQIHHAREPVSTEN